jgi:hypothetical protein
VAERDLNQAYPLGVALGINFSFLLSLCVWACQRRADALLSVGDYSAALKDLEALQCMGCTDTASRLADCRHRVKRGGPAPQPDHYAVMGVASTASASDIKQAYRSVRTASQGEGDTVGETDHYAVMGVASTASASDVKQAYRSVRTASQGEGDTVGETRWERRRGRHRGRDTQPNHNVVCAERMLSHTGALVYKTHILIRLLG